MVHNGQIVTIRGRRAQRHLEVVYDSEDPEFTYSDNSVLTLFANNCKMYKGFYSGSFLSKV